MAYLVNSRQFIVYNTRYIY